MLSTSTVYFKVYAEYYVVLCTLKCTVYWEVYSHQKEESPPDTDTVWLAAHLQEDPDSGSLTMVLAAPPKPVPPCNEVLFVNRNTHFHEK